nr:unnamed protein product [Spirometra erinaceieuropaei]
MATFTITTNEHALGAPLPQPRSISVSSVLATIPAMTTTTGTPTSDIAENTPATNTTTPTCSYSDSDFMSRIGLVSHLRIHRSET